MPINFLAVIVAVIASFIVGFLWYSPALFGKTWQRLIGKSSEELRKDARKAYAWNILGTIITALVLSVLFDYASIDTPTKAISSMILVWIGILMPFSANDALFSGRNIKLWLLNGLHQLVTLLVMGYIIAIWR